MINKINININNSTSHELILPKVYFGRVSSGGITGSGDNLTLLVQVNELVSPYTPQDGDQLVLLFESSLNLRADNVSKFKIRINGGDWKYAVLNGFNLFSHNFGIPSETCYDIDSGSCINFLFSGSTWKATNGMSQVPTRFYVRHYTDSNLVDGNWNGTQYQDTDGLAGLPAGGYLTGNLKCYPYTDSGYGQAPHICLGIVGWNCELTKPVYIYAKSIVYETYAMYNSGQMVTLRVGIYNPNTSAVPSSGNGKLNFMVGWIY